MLTVRHLLQDAPNLKEIRKDVPTELASLVNRMLAAAGWSRTVRFWDTSSGRLLLELPGHDGPIYDLAWSHDSKQLLTASADRTVRLWNVQSRRELKRYIGHEDAVRSVGLSADAKVIASAGEDA